MATPPNAKAEPSHAPVYQIRLKGHLGREWTDWFDGLTITLEEDGDTLLSGPVADQAALHALLRKVRNLGMPLLSVNCIEPGPSARLEGGLCVEEEGLPPTEDTTLNKSIRREA
ncbi:MAG: hypothetical protein PVH95_12515 [Anaerolineae bacterium]